MHIEIGAISVSMLRSALRKQVWSQSTHTHTRAYETDRYYEKAVTFEY